KYRNGESNLLVKISAEAQLKQIRLKKQQAESDVSVFQSELQQWTGSQLPIIISDKELKTLVPTFLINANTFNQNPLFDFQQQQINITIAELKLEKSKSGPSFQVGAFNQ